jgi:WD40 repeat protein/tRNA A-37 threonylcarbamoyl transferase component Bud32
MTDQPADPSMGEQRLDEIIAAYLEAERRGQAPDRQQLLHSHPDLAAELQSFFADKDHLDAFAEPLSVFAPVQASSDTETVAPPPTAAAATQNELSDHLPGEAQDFGDYELLEEIARGGMGVVYKARQRSLNRVVALKMILSGQLASASDVQRFYAEARTAANLQHPNIVAIHEVGQLGGQHYFSMDYIEGRSLAALTREHPLAATEAAAFVKTVASAIHYAHQRGVLHRDLKPANVLIDSAGQPRVTDFGLAKRIEGDARLTASGAVLGTPSYMPPEQAGANRGQVGPASDVYSLGAVLYELVTGRPPFAGPTPLDTLLQVLSDEPVPLRQLQPKLPRNLETICLTCLHKEPRKRYGTAQELAEDLHRFLAGEPILARPAGITERALRWVKRRPLVAALSAVAVALLLAMFGVLAWGWQQADGRATAQADARKAAEKQAAAQAEARWAAEKQAEAEKKRADEASRRVHAIKAHIALDNASTRLDRGDISAGLLWLVRSLEEAPEDEVELKQSVRRLLGGWRAELTLPRAVLPEDRFVNGISFAPDGKTFATTGRVLTWWNTMVAEHLYDLTQGSFVRRWDAKTLKPVAEHLDKVSWGPWDKVFSHDGRKLLLFHPRDNTRILDLETGKFTPASLPERVAINSVTVSPDGATVALLHPEAPASVWDLKTAKHKFDLHAPGDPVKLTTASVVFSADGKTIISADDSGVRRWSADTGKLMGQSLLQPSRLGLPPIRGRDGWTVASADGNKLGLYFPTKAATAFLDTSCPEKAFVYPILDGGKLNNMVLSKDGAFLAVFYDNWVAIWNWGAGDPMFVSKFMIPPGPPPWPQAMFAPDNKTLVTAWGTCLLWDVPQSPRKFRQLGMSTVRAVAFSPDGKTVLANQLAADGSACDQRWDLSTGKPVGQAFPCKSALWSFQAALAFSPDGKYMASLGQPRPPDRRISALRLWDVATAREIGELTDPSFPNTSFPGHANGLAFSADSRSLVVVGTALQGGREPKSADYCFRWDLSTRKLVAAHPLKRGTNDLCWRVSPRGTYFYHCGNALEAPNGVEWWDSTTGKPAGAPIGLGGDVNTVAFSPDERLILTTSSKRADGSTEARLWDAVTGRPVGEPRACIWTAIRNTFPQSTAFAPDGKSFVLVGNRIQFWDTAAFRPIGQIGPLLDAVDAVAFDPRGEILAVGLQSQGILLVPAPRLLQADVERIRLWVEVATWRELDAAGAVVDLDVKSWRQRWQRLEKRGGPP